MSLPLTNVSQFPQEARDVLRRFVGQVKKITPNQIDGIFVFGSLVRGDYISGRSNLNVFVLIKALSLEDFQRYGRAQRGWSKMSLVAPLFMTHEEFLKSSRLFPLEYVEMKDFHLILDGRDPFPELHIDVSGLSMQCQREIMGNLIRLRQGFVEGWGRPEAVQALLPVSITALLPCLRGIVRVMGRVPGQKDEIFVSQLPEFLQIDDAVLKEVLDLKRGSASPGIHELPRLFGRYATTLDGLVTRLHALSLEGRI